MKLLDLFCGAGGCSMGYHRAGFEVVGIDHGPQKNYPFEFHKANVFEWLKNNDLKQFDFIHASPPCKCFTKTGWSFHFEYHKNHEDLLTPTREVLINSKKPYVIENVPGAPMKDSFILCGSMFGLGVRRHRHFETNPPLFQFIQSCNHKRVEASPHGHPRKAGEGATWGPAMDIDWMSCEELSQAIPPAYTEWIGKQLLNSVKGVES